MTGGNTAFLQHFPQPWRARNGALFWEAVRSIGSDGSDRSVGSEARKICSLVYRQVAAALKRDDLSDDRRLSYHHLKDWLEDDRPGAMLLALYCLEWEEATPAERKLMRVRDREARVEAG